MRWRKRWARTWEEVRWCSDGCRARGLDGDDAALERAILALLARRARGATICPSEAARAVHGSNEARWRAAMEAARAAGRRLANRGLVEFVQRGEVVAPSTARGPVRLRALRDLTAEGLPEAAGTR